MILMLSCLWAKPALCQELVVDPDHICSDIGQQHRHQRPAEHHQ